jgi:DNA-binding transcriptional MocR family regulator
MSIAAINHVKARWEGLLPSDKLILAAIAERTEKTRGCWPSRRILAIDTGLSLDTVKRSLKRLAEKRFIHRSGRMNESGSRASSLIEIVGFADPSPVGAACTQRWVQEVPQGGCSEAPRVGAASPLTYKDEPKIEPEIEPKGEARDARDLSVELIPLETSKADPLEAFHSYNRTAQEIGLPVARSLPPGRRKSINARFREHGADTWATVLENIRASDFLQGKNDRGWRPNLDWIIKPENYAKVLEGNYAPSAQAAKADRTAMTFVPSRWGPGKWVPKVAEVVQ